MLFPILACAEEGSCPELLSSTQTTLVEHKQVLLCDVYRNKVLLIVNTASKCAFTPQYEALERLYDRYKEQGLVVLGFPSNDFGEQEPGSEAQIHSFCRMTFDVQFPMFSKTIVRGSSASPLYKALAEASGTYPQWNFHKYLINRKGKLIDSYKSAVEPENRMLVAAIEAALHEQSE